MSNPNPSSGGPPLRALAMVLIALAIVFAGLGAMSLSKSGTSTSSASTGSSSSEAATTTTASSSSSSAEPATTTTTEAPTTTAAAGVDKSIPVRVLNNSTVAGLAAKTGSRLTASGWNVVATGNYATSILSKTTVFYQNSREQATAQAIAGQLGGFTAPRGSNLARDGAGIVVIVTGE